MKTSTKTARTVLPKGHPAERSGASCIQSAVAILGDKWTPLLIHALGQEPLRFCRLQSMVGGVNPRTLSARLAFLEQEGILSKTTLSTIPPHTEYRLTPMGRELLPIIAAMAAWTSRHGETARTPPRDA